MEIRAWVRAGIGPLKTTAIASLPDRLNLKSYRLPWIRDLFQDIDYRSIKGFLFRIRLRATGVKKEGAPLNMNEAQVVAFHKTKEFPIYPVLKVENPSRTLSHHRCTRLWNWSWVLQLNDTCRGQLYPYAYPQRTSHQVMKCILYMLHVRHTE